MGFGSRVSSPLVPLGLVLFLFVVMESQSQVVLGLKLNAKTAPPPYPPPYPPAYQIPNVPYFKQLSDYACGDTSLEMVLSYWGPWVDQNAIIDAARTTDGEGTLSYDITRVGHFSALSSAVGDMFPRNRPMNGFIDHPLGYAAFDYDSQEPWLDQIKYMVSQNIPVICLQHYSLEDPGGHFRVVVGYDDTIGNITVHDPWDYDDNPPIGNYSYEYFIQLWNYTENNSPRKNPFMGAAIYPWSINVTLAELDDPTSLNISAAVAYPCYSPFDCTEFPASNVLISIQLPDNCTLPDTQLQGVTYPSLAAGQSINIEPWTVICGEDPSGLDVTITAQGIIQGSLPATFKSATVNYPPYNYIDAIGNSVTITL